MPTRSPLEHCTIAFDLDGTLVDTAPDLIACTNLVMGEAGLAACDPADLRPLIGLGAKALLRKAHMAQGLEPEEEDLNNLLRRFLDLYGETCTLHSRPFPQAESTLQELKDLGARLTVCTNKHRNLSVKVLDGLDLSSYFDGLFCPDDVVAHKPDPAHVHAALAPHNQGLLVGDSETDFLAARNAFIPIILLGHGYSEIRIEDLPAQGHLPGFDGLTDKIVELLA